MNAPFGASRKIKLVHRVRNCTADSAKWLCGSSSVNAFFVEDPSEFGGICGRCEALFAGVAALRLPPDYPLSLQASLPSSGDGMIYRCYSADGHLLYIGSCRSWPSRRALHEKQTAWWPQVDRVEQEHYLNLGAAKQAEIAAIGAEAPLHNKQHNVRRFRWEKRTYVPVAQEGP